MKKLIIITVAMLAYGGFCMAEIPTNWTSLENIHPGVSTNENVDGDYYPLTFYFDGTARSEDLGMRHLRASLNVGISSTTPFNLGTLAGQKRYYQALPAFLKPVLLDLRDQATGDDLSE